VFSQRSISDLDITKDKKEMETFLKKYIFFTGFKFLEFAYKIIYYIHIYLH